MASVPILPAGVDLADAPGADAPVIAAIGVCCAHGATPILHGVDLALHRGRITVVLGPSGAGKSTFLRALAGLEPLTAGRIVAGGAVLSRPGAMIPPEARGIGLVVQDFALFPHLTAAKNIGFGLPAPRRAQAAQEWLARMGLAGRGGSYPHELSGGQQQRVALARALAREPAIVLLDEAFSSLDLQLRRELRQEAEGLLRAAGAAVLMVTHDPEEALELADELVVMENGRITQAGRPEALYWQPSSRTVARLLGAINEIEGEVRSGQWRCVFGALPAPDQSEGARLLALVRPGAVQLAHDEASALVVAEARFMGSAMRVRVAAGDGSGVLVDLPSGAGLAPGDRVRLLIDPARATLLPI